MKITNFELYDIVTNGDKEEIDSLEELELEGWVKTNRDNGSIGFVEFNDGTYEKQVQLLNRSGKVIKTDTCYTYTTFSLSKNTVYYVRYREMDYDYASGQTYYSSWSGKLGFCTAKFKLSLIRKGRKVKYKAPKVAGVKSFRIYVSTKSGSKYKKVKTLKPGKSFKIKKFRGKKIKVTCRFKSI